MEAAPPLQRRGLEAMKRRGFRITLVIYAFAHGVPSHAFPYKMIAFRFLLLLPLHHADSFNRHSLPGNRPLLYLIIAEQNQVTVTS